MGNEDIAVLAVPFRQGWILITVDGADRVVRNEDDDAGDALIYALYDGRDVVSHAKQRLPWLLTFVAQQLNDAMESVSHPHEKQVLGLRRLDVILPQIARQLFSLLLCLFVVWLQIRTWLVADVGCYQLGNIDVDNTKGVADRPFNIVLDLISLSCRKSADVGNIARTLRAYQPRVV
jgi:hypothetical protein